MAVSHYMKPGYGARRSCQIITVDPVNRKIEGALKDKTIVQIAVFDTPEFFVWPKPREYWTIQQCNGIWMLDRRLGEKDDLQVEHLNPGEGKLGADVIKTPSNKSVVVVDDTNALEGQTIKYINNEWMVTNFPDPLVDIATTYPLIYNKDTNIISIDIGTTASTVAAGDDSRIVGAEQQVNKNAANGYAGLDENSKMSVNNLPIGTDANSIAAGNHTHAFAAVVTELPANPSIHDEIYFLVDENKQITWHLKYSEAGWIFVGGPPLVKTAEATGYQSSPTLQTWYSYWDSQQLLNCLVPLAGEYQVAYTASLIPESTPSNNEYLGFDIAVAKSTSNPPSLIEDASTAYFYTDMHSAPALTATSVYKITFAQGVKFENRVVQLVIQFNKSSNWYTSIRTKVINQTLSILPAGPLSNW